MSDNKRRPSDRAAVYVISVVSEILGMHPQTLRQYERKGLLDPQRTGGNSRRYSEKDLDHLRRIQELTQEGINLSGVRRILDLERRIERMQAQLERMQQKMVEREREFARERRLNASRSVPVRLSDVRDIFERRGR